MPEGLSDLERELQRDPRSRKFYDLAREYQKAGRLTEALRVCESGLKNHPNMAQARVLHAQLLLASGDLQTAKSSVQRALLVLPDNVAANHLAAEIFWGLEETAQALKHYQIVHLFDPGREGVLDRIHALTTPPDPQPEVVPSTEVEAILGPAQKVDPEESPEPEEVVLNQGEMATPSAHWEPVPDEADQEPDEFPGSAGTAIEGVDDSPIADMELCPPTGETIPATEEEVPLGEIPEEVRGEVSEIPAEGEGSEPEGCEEAGPILEVASLEAAPGEGSDTAVDAFESLGTDDGGLGEGLLDIGGELPWSAESEEALVLDQSSSPEPPLPPIRQDPPSPTPVEPLHTVPILRPPAGIPATDSLSTLTLGRLYEQQGYPEKAVEVYQRLLIRNPDDPEVLGRIHALRDQMERGAVEPDLVDQDEIRRALRQRSIRALNDWLRRMREERHVS
jgi:tetratricopeptide (TPR) repeat protein